MSNVEVKGHDEPVTAYRALGPAESSLDQDRTSINRLTPLLGRTSERDLLYQRWSQACAGEGQIVLLCGEPGVGKTRLLQELDRQVREEPANRILLYCSTFQQNTALYPIRRQLERALGLKPEHSATTKRSMLRQMLASLDVDVGRHEPLLSRLLSLTTDEEEQASGFTAEQVRARTLEALVDMTQAMARQRPTLLVVEDLHWIDPTTQAFLDELLAQIATWQLLVVLTFRPEFEAPWVRHPQATFLTLQYLGQKDCGALVRQIAGTHDLPERVVEDIIARTDGVPLFVEELTKTVIESNIVNNLMYFSPCRPSKGV